MCRGPESGQAYLVTGPGRKGGERERGAAKEEGREGKVSSYCRGGKTSLYPSKFSAGTPVTEEIKTHKSYKCI